MINETLFQDVYNLFHCESNEIKRILIESGFDLSGSDFNDIDLSEINLSQQDLSGLDLRYTDFKDSILTGANFSKSILNPKKVAAGKNALDAILDNEVNAAIRNIDLLDQSIFFTGIRTQERNIIRNCGITNIGRLVTISESDALGIYGIGKYTINDIKRFLHNRDLSLGMKIYWDDPVGDQIAENNVAIFHRRLSFAMSSLVLKDLDDVHEFVNEALFRASLKNVYFVMQFNQIGLEVNSFSFSSSSQQSYKIYAPFLSRRPIIFARIPTASKLK